jgi:formamidopyrimidine-DNA glycosylase
MPELPEVETIARCLAPDVTGRTITRVQVLLPRTVRGDRAFAAKTQGRKITAVRRRAKLLLLELESSLVLAFHLKMTGRLWLPSPEAQPSAHTRLIFDLDNGARLFFDDTRTFGYCLALTPEELKNWDFYCSLGPEPLETTAEELTKQLSERSGRIKGLLLNQQVVAGIGNIYADESLFRAGINPEAAPRNVGEARLVGLFQSIQEVLSEAIADCGSSIRDYRDAHGNAGAFQNKFRVYGRGGKPCVECGKKLKSTKVAGRTTVYCSRCQKK